ncbi:hypothetical protein [Komagataeibacter medellinensis]|uniref:hypothetical protein n=1 Tax=Komagataeibacter medellinensis TaxID=1177712 RepID=UPI0018862767|nr:hypothetical protein [Komagataeibacter medellinensis]
MGIRGAQGQNLSPSVPYTRHPVAGRRHPAARPENLMACTQNSPHTAGRVVCGWQRAMA